MERSRVHTRQTLLARWLHRQSWKSLPLFESSETLEFELDIASQSNAQSFRHNHNLTQELQCLQTRWGDPEEQLIERFVDNIG